MKWRTNTISYANSECKVKIKINFKKRGEGKKKEEKRMRKKVDFHCTILLFQHSIIIPLALLRIHPAYHFIILSNNLFHTHTHTHTHTLSLLFFPLFTSLYYSLLSFFSSSPHALPSAVEIILSDSVPLSIFRATFCSNNKTKNLHNTTNDRRGQRWRGGQGRGAAAAGLTVAWTGAGRPRAQTESMWAKSVERERERESVCVCVCV